MARRARTLEGVEVSKFWRDRPTFVTGSTGLLGGWLVKSLVQLGADVVCLVRDWVPESAMVRGGLIEKVRVVRGDVRDRALLERILGEYEVDTVLHLAAQTIVPIANRNPISTFEANIEGTWSLLEACRRSPWSNRSCWPPPTKPMGTTKSYLTMRRHRCREGIPTT